MKNKIKEYLENDPKILEILKDDNRSYLFVFEFEGKKYVYKEPREKNTRKWQKFLSIFRGPESKREFYQMKKINSLGFLSCKETFFEKNYLVYEYLEARSPKFEDVYLILDELNKIHSLGYLHGDSQISNFLIDKDEKVYVIDAKFRKNFYGKFGSFFELIYLEESLDGKILNFDKDNIYYKAGMLLKKYLFFYSNLKNKIRRR